MITMFQSIEDIAAHCRESDTVIRAVYSIDDEEVLILGLNVNKEKWDKMSERTRETFLLDALSVVTNVEYTEQKILSCKSKDVEE